MMPSTEGLQRKLVDFLRGVVPILRPVEKAYGELYDPSWGDTFRKVHPNLSASEAGQAIECMADLTFLFMPPKRKEIHPLDRRLNEMIYVLGISDKDHRTFPLAREYSGKKELSLNGQDIKGLISFFDMPECWNNEAPNGRYYSTYFHSIRTAAFMLATFDQLGFDKEWLVHGFIAGLGHDSGNIVFTNLQNRGKKFPEYNGMVKAHPVASREEVKDIDPISAAMVERHHIWQDDPYPPHEELMYPMTPEVEAGSKLLACIDCYDAAMTREPRQGPTVADLVLRGGLSCREKVRRELMATHAGLRITYRGDLLPHMDFSGQEFFQEMYAKGVFGRDAFDPYPRPYSFLKRSTIQRIAPHLVELMTA